VHRYHLLERRDKILLLADSICYAVNTNASVLAVLLDSLELNVNVKVQHLEKDIKHRLHKIMMLLKSVLIIIQSICETVMLGKKCIIARLDGSAGKLTANRSRPARNVQLGSRLVHALGSDPSSSGHGGERQISWRRPANLVAQNPPRFSR
jgi:sulfur transfer complex TusBCD TusB component (DsrH family)